MIQKIRTVLNKPLVIKIKHGLVCFSFVIFTMTGFWYQNREIKYQQCITRVEGRNDLRQTLLYVVDLNDVLPNDPGAVKYTINRTRYINFTWPALDPNKC